MMGGMGDVVVVIVMIGDSHVEWQMCEWPERTVSGGCEIMCV